MPTPILARPESSRIKSLSYSVRWHLRLSHPPLSRYDLPPLSLLKPAWNLDQREMKSQGIIFPYREGTRAAPRCRQEFFPKASGLPRCPEAQQPPSPKATAQGASGFVQLLCCLEGNKEGIFFACSLIQSANIPHTHKKKWAGKNWSKHHLAFAKWIS